MKWQRAASGATKLPRHGRPWLGAVALLSLSAPFLAVGHAANAQSSLPHENDPFAVYEVNLSDAADKALDRVAQPEPETAAKQNDHPSQAEQTRMLSSAGDAQNAWQRVTQLRPMFDPILREAGVPTELAAVVVVESGGNPWALSPKGARGLWQLMPDTARRYGLRVDAEVDERLDAVKSTQAAAAYLRDLFAEFHDWPLALAAYNAGEQNVQQAMARTGAKVFSIAARALPAETQNYVPAVFNALARVGGGAGLQPASSGLLRKSVYATEAR